MYLPLLKCVCVYIANLDELLSYPIFNQYDVDY
jgi:hypothetical protein